MYNPAVLLLCSFLVGDTAMQVLTPLHIGHLARFSFLLQPDAFECTVIHQIWDFMELLPHNRSCSIKDPGRDKKLILGPRFEGDK